MAAAARRTRTRGALLAAAAAVAVVALAGCTAGAAATPETAPPPARTAAVPTGPDCLAPQVLEALGFTAGEQPARAPHADAPAAGAVPDGFVPVSAVLCSTGETLTDAAGRWAAVTASRLEGDVAPLTRAVREPAEPSASPCAPGAPRSDLWLVDALGAGIRVLLPGGGCGPLPEAVAAGLADLDEVDVEHYPVRLVEPGAATTAAATP